MNTFWIENTFIEEYMENMEKTMYENVDEFLLSPISKLEMIDLLTVIGYLNSINSNKVETYVEELRFRKDKNSMFKVKYTKQEKLESIKKLEEEIELIHTLYEDETYSWYDLDQLLELTERKLNHWTQALHN